MKSETVFTTPGSNVTAAAAVRCWRCIFFAQFLASWEPAADVMALATAEFELKDIEMGETDGWGEDIRAKKARVDAKGGRGGVEEEEKAKDTIRGNAIMFPGYGSYSR